MGRACLLSFALGLLCSSRPAAGQALDIDKWLRRPQVRLLAVEFYATWCKPCMKAVPRWRALHERYRGEGLRLVVVAVRDPKAAACANVGWMPDQSVCDLSGAIADRFGGVEKIPQAFLWSWQGDLLVKQGHVDEVERAAQAYLNRSPKVAVEAFDARGKTNAALAMTIRRQLTQSGKMTVVASDAEQRRLRRLRKQSHRPDRDDQQACELGRAVSANMQLEARRVGDGRHAKLVVSLYSIERGCLIASQIVNWTPRDPTLAAGEAIGALMDDLRETARMPGAPAVAKPAPTTRDETFGGGGEWDPTAGADRKVVLKVTSKPVGAVVLLDGRLVCNATPCAVVTTAGSYQLEVQKQQYLPQTRAVRLRANRNVTVKLSPDFAEISVVTTPPGVAITVDGDAAGVAPIKARRVKPGRHEIAVNDPCFSPVGKRITMTRGEVREITISVNARPAAIDVVAFDAQKNAVVADVLVDDARVGATPGVYKVGVCAKQVQIKHPTLGSWSKPLSLKEKQVLAVEATFKAPRPTPSTKAGGPPAAKARKMIKLGDGARGHGNYKLALLYYRKAVSLDATSGGGQRIGDTKRMQVDAGRLADAFAPHIGVFNPCYDPKRHKNRRVSFKVTVDAAGIGRVSGVYMDPEDGRLSRCMVKRGGKIRLRTPESAPTTFKYRLVFGGK